MKNRFAFVVKEGPLKGGIRGIIVGSDRMVERNMKALNIEHGCEHVGVLMRVEDGSLLNYDFDSEQFVPRGEMDIILPRLVVGVQGQIEGIPEGAWVSVGTECIESFNGGDLFILSEIVCSLGVTINHLRYQSFVGEINVAAN